MIRASGALLLAFTLTILVDAQRRWLLRSDGIGTVKVGMTLAQLNSALHQHFSLPADDQACFYVKPKNHPQVRFMIEDGSLVRVDVNKPGVATTQGIQVGDTEAHVKVFTARS
jgi:hypothetical protein